MLLTTRPVSGSEQMRRSGSPPHQTSHPLQMEFIIAPVPATSSALAHLPHWSHHIAHCVYRVIFPPCSGLFESKILFYSQCPLVPSASSTFLEPSLGGTQLSGNEETPLPTQLPASLYGALYFYIGCYESHLALVESGLN